MGLRPLPRVDSFDLFLVLLLVGCCGLSFEAVDISEWVFEQTDSPGLGLATLAVCYLVWIFGMMFLSWKISMRGIRFNQRIKG